MDAVISDKIAQFFASYPERTYKKGQILIFASDNPGKVFHIIDGVVKQYDVTYRGDEIILNVFKAPAFFPMSPAINDSHNPFTFEAETDIVVRVAPAKDVVAFIRDNPDVLYDLLSRVYNGIDGLLGRIVHLMASSAKARLMFEILIACKRQGELQTGGNYKLAINEKELGSRAGLSRETVSREMSKLIKEELVSLNKGTLTVRNLDVFETRLGKVI